MSLAEDIKQQKPFKSEYQKAIVNVIFTNYWLMTQQANMMKPYDLTTQQYNVLRILRGQYPKPITVNAIIERMIDKMSNASRLVDKLLAKGFLTRNENKADRRACDIMITDKGLEVLDRLDASQSIWESKFTSITPEEAETLSGLLDKLRNSK
jgi:DNA-binding MarR family transcriptional regulator